MPKFDVTVRIFARTAAEAIAILAYDEGTGSPRPEIQEIHAVPVNELKAIAAKDKG